MSMWQFAVDVQFPEIKLSWSKSIIPYKSNSVLTLTDFVLDNIVCRNVPSLCHRKDDILL